MDFKDHFSKQSAIYRKARPSYPDELFTFLASVAPGHALCWDCGTGNGQAAVALAPYFTRVVATDGSANQIANALPAANVEYRVSIAEQSCLPDHCADLITAATAAHWFNHDRFYAEVSRIARPGGIIALWTYSEAFIDRPIDLLMEWFMYDYLHDYWPDGRWYVRNRYETLPFPFQPMPTPRFFCRKNWKQDEWLNYVRSWSAYNQYLQQNHTDPLPLLKARLDTLWPPNEIREVTWPLHLKCARINESSQGA